MLVKCSRGTPALLVLLLVGGCSSLGGGSDNATSYYLPQASGNNPIKIESVPSGADVFAMGEKLGTTPLAVDPKDVFPITYPKEKEGLYGKVTLKMAGCSDLTKTVSTKIMNGGFRAQLQCAGSIPALSEKPKDASDSSATVEQRLITIKNLLDKGLITEEEAKRARERVLNEL